jgi:hypothetical protein
MSRNLLHFNKLEDFKGYCKSLCVEVRESLHDFGVIDIKPPNSKIWFTVYKKLDAREHYTVDRRIESLVRKFIEVRKKNVRNEIKHN